MPTIIDGYIAQCCGTCAHREREGGPCTGYVKCGIDGVSHRRYSVCAPNYIQERE